ncbi:MAG: hypothetical protein P1V20_15265 [Verrucomicrobiales bacterium]|nr:hypothetical protein [Verrucomicrobiales bacterium]
MSIHRLLPLFFCLSVLPVLAHDGHHHEEQGDSEAVQVKIPGAQVEMIEDRVIEGSEVTAIPLSSIFIEGGKNFVWAQDEEDLQKFSRWEVVLGRSDGRYVEAVTGVFPGDHVAINAQPVVAQRSQPVVPQHREPVYTENRNPQPVVPRSQYPSSREGGRFVPEIPHFDAAPVVPQFSGTVPLPPVVQVPDKRIIEEYLRFLSQRNGHAVPVPAPESVYVCPHGRVHRIPQVPNPQQWQRFIPNY